MMAYSATFEMLSRHAGLGVLDENMVGVDRKHEPAEWPTDRAGADTQETIARAASSLDQERRDRGPRAETAGSRRPEFASETAELARPRAE